MAISSSGRMTSCSVLTPPPPLPPHNETFSRKTTKKYIYKHTSWGQGRPNDNYTQSKQPLDKFSATLCVGIIHVNVFLLTLLGQHGVSVTGVSIVGEVGLQFDIVSLSLCFATLAMIGCYANSTTKLLVTTSACQIFQVKSNPKLEQHKILNTT